MELIKFAAIGIIFLGVFSFMLWLLGLWSRRSALAKFISALFILLSALALLAAYFIKSNIGSIAITMQDGTVKQKDGVELQVAIKLNQFHQSADTLFVQDAEGREFVVHVPSGATGAIVGLPLYPMKSVLLSHAYAVLKVRSLFIVVTWGKLGAFVLSVLAIGAVWAAGNEKKFAVLVPDGGD